MEEQVFNSEEQLANATPVVSPQIATSEADPLTVSPVSTVPKNAKTHAGRKIESEHWLGVVQWLCGTVVIAVFVITFLTQAFQIPSESMEKTLLVGDYLLVDKVHFAQSGIWEHLLPYQPISRGDIIVFRYPVRPSQHFVKRVIALPGDRVHLREGRVYVNGLLVQDQAYAAHNSRQYDSYRDDFPNDSYISSDVNSTWWVQMHHAIRNGELVVPPNQYFVLGDNRDHSLDSRYWGFVPRENVIGRPLVIYWSMKQPEAALAGAADGKLSNLVYRLTHLLENARWSRSLRVVH
jgi:signal peptidase I